MSQEPCERILSSNENLVLHKNNKSNNNNNKINTAANNRSCSKQTKLIFDAINYKILAQICAKHPIVPETPRLFHNYVKFYIVLIFYCSPFRRSTSANLHSEAYYTINFHCHLSLSISVTTQHFQTHGILIVTEILITS